VKRVEQIIEGDRLALRHQRLCESIKVSRKGAGDAKNAIELLRS
jgi:hypothetical protein